MDCEKANKGLFSGLLIAVVTLIAIATFFVFDSRLNNPTTAIKVSAQHGVVQLSKMLLPAAFSTPPPPPHLLFAFRLLRRRTPATNCLTDLLTD